MDFPSLKIISKKNRITTTKDIQAVETKIGLRIPNDFKQFLLQYQGGTNLDINHIVVNYGNNFVDKVAIVNISDIDEILNSWNMIKDYETCKGILTFGNTLGDGRFWGISLNIEDYNSVYLYEASLERNKVAATFSEFLNKIIFDESSMLDFL